MRKRSKTTLLGLGFAAVVGAGVAALGMVAGLVVAAEVFVAFGVVQSIIAYDKKKTRQKLEREAKSRGLTGGEVSFVRSIFGNKISGKDLARVRQYMIDETCGSTVTCTSGGDMIKVYKGFHEGDYSASETALNYGTFIHEMTHVWQQTRLTPIALRYAFDKRARSQGYDYTLSETSRFGQFGIEQQAAIVEDYARRFLFPVADVATHWGDVGSAADARLQKVVEDKFPAARESRLAMEGAKKEQLKQEAKLSYAFRLAADVRSALQSLVREPGMNMNVTERKSVFSRPGQPDVDILRFVTNIPKANGEGDSWIGVLPDGYVASVQNGNIVNAANAAQAVDELRQRRHLSRPRAP